MARKQLGTNETVVPHSGMHAILGETQILEVERKSPTCKSEDSGQNNGVNQPSGIDLDDIEADLSRCVSELEAVSHEWEDLKDEVLNGAPEQLSGKVSAESTGISSHLGSKHSHSDEPPNSQLVQLSEREVHPSRPSRSPSPDIASMSIGRAEAPPSRPSSRAASPACPLRVDVDAPEPGVTEASAASAEDERDERPKAVMPWPQRADKEYECLESCGAGSYGEVYKARRRGGDGKTVAVKVIESDRDALEEAALLRDLDHPCICKLYDCFECPEEGVTCLVMQYASGGDLLSKIVNSGPVTEKVAAGLAEQLLLALQHMHSKGVLHRDLKPENVLYLTDSLEQPLLADFGVGKRLAAHHAHARRDSSLGSIEEPPPPFSAHRSASGLRTHSRRIGTVGYSAPEINSEHGHSFAADVWSFGALLYVLLCGYHPFDMGDDADDVIQARVSQGEVLPMAGDGWECVSEEAKDFVRQCLVVDVKARATIDDCLHHPWLAMDFMDVVELVDAFQKLKVYHSSRRESKTVAAKETATRLKRKREASVASDDSSAGSLTPTPSKRFLNVPYHPTTVCQQGVLEWAVSESEPSLQPFHMPLHATASSADGPAKPARKRAISGSGTASKTSEREAASELWGKREKRAGGLAGESQHAGGAPAAEEGAEDSVGAGPADGSEGGGEAAAIEVAEATGSDGRRFAEGDEKEGEKETSAVASKKRSPSGSVGVGEAGMAPLQVEGGSQRPAAKSEDRQQGRKLFTLDEAEALQSVFVWQADSGEESLEKLTLGPEDPQQTGKPALEGSKDTASEEDEAAADEDEGEGDDRLDWSAKRKRGRSADAESPSEAGSQLLSKGGQHRLD